ncbi:peptidyl serine alpha-galactosyltransferase-like isoform X2 [Andrographis paniculata]|uniref:peptidyl serine alpha-galactosyltransferase-like isoform X2 n=1 Tax=Andrographis paniculata TaxID=175694 RepID=UPI0021E86DDC|nr:peptidyl serine alpha-galactosyltransferase-like isoform X2 [Andrographis paniculata]
MAIGRFHFLLVATVVVSMSRGGAQKSSHDAVVGAAPYRIHTLFSVECQTYSDWQTVGLMHSFRKAKQPGLITRLLSCTEERKKTYRGMDLAPTLQVPSMSHNPRTGDWYPAINKPAGVVHWLKHSKHVNNVDWVVILDPDMIIRGPIIPWELGAEKGRPVSAYYGYLVGCDNVLAKLHTKHPQLCDKVGGLLAMHIDDLRDLAHIWLSKTEQVREDRAHWATDYTGDIYGEGWISEMYGYSFGAAEEGVEPILLHYGLPFTVGNWSFSKLDHHEDNIVYECGQLFPEPPYPRDVDEMERDPNKRRALFLSIECINTINEGLLLHHAARGCPKPKQSKYLSFLRSKAFAELTQPKHLTPATRRMMEENTRKQDVGEPEKQCPKIHTLFSTQCFPYFDWQTVGLIRSFHLSGQPGNITRLLSCTEEELKEYKGHNLAPTHYVPSMSRHPLTGDWYPAINKPAAVLHWINHVKTDAEYVVILEPDMIMKGPITPWEFNADKGRPVSAPNEYLIGCDNELARAHTHNPGACDKVGGVIIMHIRDLRRFSSLWLHKTKQLRADVGHWSKYYTGDIYNAGWLSEMYGYAFAAAELNMRHKISSNILIYPGHMPAPGVSYRVYHYGLEFRVGNWSFDKAKYRHLDVVNKCWVRFPDPPDPSTLHHSEKYILQRDLLSIDCVNSLNEALRRHDERKKCSDIKSLPTGAQPTPDLASQSTSTRKSPSLPSLPASTPNPPSSPPPHREITTKIEKSMKLENLENIDADKDISDLRNKLQDLAPPGAANQAFRSMRLRIIGLWTFSVVGFVAVIAMVIYRHKGQRKRGKTHKISRR